MQFTKHKVKAKRQQLVEQFLENLQEQWAAGRFNASTDVDYDLLMSHYFHGSKETNAKILKESKITNMTWGDVRKAFAAKTTLAGHRDIQESLLDALTSGGVADLMTTIYRFNVIEREEHAPLTLSGLVNNNLRLGPNKERWYKQVNPADVVDDNVAELEPTKFKGVAKLPYIVPPEPLKKRLAFALSRELGTADVGNVVRQQVDAHGAAMDLHKELLLVDLLYGLYDTTTPGANPFKYIVNDVEFHPYQAVGSTAGWENDLTANPLDGTYAPFQNLAAILENARDPYSGLPLNVSQNGVIVTTNEASRQMAQDGLSIIDMERTGASIGATTITFRNASQAARFNIGVNDIVTDSYVRDRLTAWYQTVAGGSLTAAAAATAAAGTWLYGDFNQAAGVGVQWDREKIERAGTGNWEYFNQDIVYAVRWEEKYTPMWTKPEKLFRNRA